MALSRHDQVVVVSRNRHQAFSFGNLAAERIAVVYPSPEPYAAIVATQFAATGVRWNGHADRAMSRRFAARWLLDVLDLPARSFARSALLNVLAGTARGRSRVLPMSLATAERLSRDAGVVDGVDGWMTRLTRLADELRAGADRYAEDPDRAHVVDARRRDATRADELRRVVVDLAADLERGAGLDRWQDLVAWAQRLCLEGDLARAEPKRLRFCLWHQAGVLARSGRRTFLRLQATWPWAGQLARAFARLQVLPLAA